MNKKIISIIYSFRNEEGNLEELINRSVSSLNSIGYDYEIIFVNDDSNDNSQEIIQKFITNNSKIKLINTTARYGQAQCTIAGIEHSKGDAIIFLDSDLQDPPEIFRELVKKWEEGYEVVHTQRTKRNGENYFKMLLTKIAYRFINRLSEVDIPIDCGDYKLIDRKVANHINTAEEEPYIRGIISWIGYKQTIIKYERDARNSGQTHFPFWGFNPIETFFIGLTSFSIFPLYISLVFTTLSIFSFIGIYIYIYLTGYNQTKMILLFVQFWITLLLISINIVSIYLARIHKQTRNRKMYIIKETMGFDDE